MELYKQVGESEFVKVFDLEDYDEGIKKLLLSICKMSYDSLEGAFGERNLENILSKYTFGEIREKYNKWKKPRVGDEVRVSMGRTFTGIILDIKKYGETEYILFVAEGKSVFSECPLSKAEKTGRHFDNIGIDALAEYVGAKDKSFTF